jgi:hypothetical protein
LMRSETPVNDRNARWEQLLTETETAKRTAISDWHIQQTRRSYSDFLRTDKQVQSAARLEEQIGNDAESNLQYWREAAVGSLARSALDYFELGDSEKAVHLGQRALQLHDLDDQPSQLHDYLIRQLRTRLELES